MRLLLDACVPRRLAEEIAGYSVECAVAIGWGGLDDRPLLDAMQGHFDVLITVDRQLPTQQGIAGRPLSVIVLRARSNRLADLLPLVPSIIAALPGLRPGEAIEVSS